MGCDIRIGDHVIASSHILYVHFAGDATCMALVDGDRLDWEPDSAESKALRWWYDQADRVVLSNPYRTIDLVALHEDAIRLAAFPRIPGLERMPAPSRLHIGPVRPCCREAAADLFVPPVAEACVESPTGGAA